MTRYHPLSPKYALAYLVFSILLSPLATLGAPQVSRTPEKIFLGIDILVEQDCRILKGKRVGLLTHPAGVNREGVSSIDILRNNKNVQLVALFGPEHGIYGKEQATTKIKDQVDTRTGLPAYSLHGTYRKPAAYMLKNLDALVIDLQDLGTRSYTYCATMKYAMEACFEKGIEVILLDRPNPQGGLLVDGPPLDKEWEGFLAPFNVPYVHGMTLGELALMLKQERGMLNVSDKIRTSGKLTVIPMRGWTRSMLWPETGLSWVPTSPNIPTIGAAIGYPMTGLGAQIGSFRHGIGTNYPFRFLTYPGKSAPELKTALEALQIPGLAYEILTVTDKKNSPKEGVYVRIVDWKRHRPTALSFHMMQLTCAWSKSNPFANASKNERDLFNKHVGSNAWWQEISQQGANAHVDRFIDRWHKDALHFQEKSKRYWLYPTR